MPANLPPQFYEVEKRLRTARTPAEKMGVIEELLTIIPKHKGTEHLRGDYKRRLAKLREEQTQKKAKGKSGADFWQIEREGAGQVPLIGLPNGGKSSLLKALTKAKPEIAPYPFTTRFPLPGMMSFEDIQIQLIDLPPLSPDFMESWVPEILRQGDLWLIVLDLDDDPLAQLKQAKAILARFKLFLLEEAGDNPPAPPWVFRPVLLAGNKLDLPGAMDTLEIYQELQKNGFPMIGLSAKEEMNLDHLKSEVFQGLDLVRAYTKVPGKEPDLSKPFILKKGSTLLDLAGEIHQDFLRKLTYARVWGKKTYAGQMVSRDYLLVDRDVIELHV